MPKILVDFVCHQKEPPYKRFAHTINPYFIIHLLQVIKYLYNILHMKQYIYILLSIIALVAAIWLYSYYFHSMIYINNNTYNSHLEYGTHNSSAIPNKIWSFWSGPMNQVVEKSIESWRHYNPTYEIIMLNKNNLHKYCNVNIAELPIAASNDTKFSDYVRLNVLAQHGGIWLDATCICHQSFDWIHGIQRATGSEFVGYYLEGNSDSNYLYKSPAIEAWFFACVPNSKFVVNWKNELMRVNDFHSIDNYLEAILSEGIYFQNYTIPNYLVINIAAQYVFQTIADKYTLYLMKAENSAFLPSVRNKWNDIESVNELKGEDTYKQFHSLPLIKLMKGMRDELVANPTGLVNLFSHLQ